MITKNTKSYFPIEIYLKDKKDNKERHVSVIWKISDFDQALEKAKEITQNNPSYSILGIHSENYTMAHVEINKDSIDIKLEDISPDDIVEIMDELAYPSYKNIVENILSEPKKHTYISTMTNIERIIDESQTYVQYLEFVHIFHKYYKT